MEDVLLGALSWNPEIKGGLYVLLAVLILPGSVYLLLGTNLGSRLGFQVAGAGLAGFMVIMGAVWWAYGIGPIGPGPTWVAQTIASGDPAQADQDALADFPEGWESLEVASQEVADAQPVVDGALTNGGEGGTFDAASDYVVVGAAADGGETYAPLGLPAVRPIDILHEPHYLLVQVQRVLEQEVPEGAAVPLPEADESSPVYSVLMLRDLGSLRLNPAVATIASALIFGLLVYQLHVRDKEAMAKRG